MAMHLLEGFPCGVAATLPAMHRLLVVVWLLHALLMAGQAVEGRLGYGQNQGEKGMGAGHQGGRRALQQDEQGVISAPEGRFPYVFSLRTSKGGHKCAAVLIHESYCLVPAHCLLDESERISLLYSGIYGLEDDESNSDFQAVKIKRTHFPPGHDSSILSPLLDLAILELPEPSEFEPVPLPDPAQLPTPGESLLSLGWGLRSSSQGLQMAFQTIQAKDECSSGWQGHISEEEFEDFLTCTQVTDTGKCLGDSSGPLILPNLRSDEVGKGFPFLDSLEALPAYTPVDCRNISQPGVYTLIAPHMEWINDIIGIEPPLTLGPAPEDEPQCIGFEARGPISMEIDAFIASFEDVNFPERCAETLVTFDSFSICEEEIGRETGCCNPLCSAFLQKVSDGCMEDVNLATCRLYSNETGIILELLSQRCDETRQTFICQDCPRDDPNVQLLLQAAQEGNLTQVDRSIAANVWLNAFDCELRDTALHLAAKFGQSPVAIALLAAGAQPDPVNIRAETPFLYAAWSTMTQTADWAANIDIMKTLLDAGADVNKQDYKGHTALYWLANECGEDIAEIVKFLIEEKGADVTLATTSGETALQRALSYKGRKCGKDDDAADNGAVIKVLKDASS